jgi:deoxyribose-phosphate aldolase
VIFETCLLTPQEIERACNICVHAGAHFVKTSTGFSSGGATVEAVSLMSRVVKPHNRGVKASGGIRSLSDLRRMVEAGATRIGTSSGLKIMQEAAAVGAH